MSDILQRVREAFDGDDVPSKNIALRRSHDEIERLRAALAHIAESDDMYEPAGWAINSARSALRRSKEQS